MASLSLRLATAISTFSATFEKKPVGDIPLLLVVLFGLADARHEMEHAEGFALRHEGDAVVTVGRRVPGKVNALKARIEIFRGVAASPSQGPARLRVDLAMEPRAIAPGACGSKEIVGWIRV